MIYDLNRRTPGGESWLLFFLQHVSMTLSYSLGVIIKNSIGVRHIRTQGKATVLPLLPEPVSLGVLAFPWPEFRSLHSAATSQLLCVNPPVVRLIRLPAGQLLGSMCQFPDILWHSFLCFLFQKSDHFADILNIRPNRRKWPKGHCANLQT